jgi:hypothetical protein
MGKTKKADSESESHATKVTQSLPFHFAGFLLLVASTNGFGLLASLPAKCQQQTHKANAIDFLCSSLPH